MRVLIVGAGKMGAWLSRALADGNETAVYDTDPQKTAEAQGKALSSIEEAGAFEPQLMINAVSLQHTIKAFEAALPHLPQDCIISDVASIKHGLEAFYRRSGRRWVSVHPMFGPTFANMDSLREENAILIKGSDSEGHAFFLRFFSKLGLRIFEYSFDEHDRMMSYSLTTPFVSSLVFAACMERDAVPGSTFARHRKIAKGLLSEDDDLIGEILFNPHSVAQIEKINGRLEYLKHIIKGRDREEMASFLSRLRKNMGSG